MLIIEETPANGKESDAKKIDSGGKDQEMQKLPSQEQIRAKKIENHKRALNYDNCRQYGKKVREI